MQFEDHLTVALRVHGTDHEVAVGARVTLLDLLRERLPRWTNTRARSARGIGELGATGVAAAVANAVFHATGKRIRDLPLTPDKLVA